MNKFFSILVDNIYRKLTNEKTCSLLYEREIFDGKEFNTNEFFEFSKPFFNEPERYYRKSKTNSYKFELNLLKETKQFKYYSFQTPFQSDFEINNTAYFRKFSNRQSSTLLIFSPGWARPNLKMEKGICRKFAKNGIDCILPVKPFHQERTPKGFYSGELFISANQLLTASNFRQYVSELRNIVVHFKDKYDKIGIVGMSSGGFQAGLLANVEQLDFYFPFLTGSELGNITWDGILTRHVKLDLLNKEVTRESLNKIWAIADQKFLGHNNKALYVKQYVSKYDQVVPTEYQMKLNHIYKNPSTYMINSAHTSVFFKLKGIINDMIKEIKFLEQN
jgi:hypothetical protein